MSNTSDEQFAVCDRTDRIFDRLLGRTLEQAALRIVGFGTLGCAVLASLSTLVS